MRKLCALSGANRARNVRDIASCCSTSEWLLWYAQSARAGGLVAPPAGVGGKTNQGGAGAIPVERPDEVAGEAAVDLDRLLRLVDFPRATAPSLALLPRASLWLTASTTARWACPSSRGPEPMR